MPSSSNHAAKITSRTRVPGQPATVVSGVNEVGEHFETFVPDTEPRDALKTVGGLGVKEINHIAFDSKDIEGSAAFYVNVLGFKLIPRPKFPFDGAWLVLGNLMIHFFPPDPEFPSTNSTSSSSSSNDPRALRRGRHLAFQVENVEEAEKKLKAARIGYTRFGIPGSPAVQLFFKDPEGRAIEVGNYLPIASGVLDAKL